MMQASRWLTVAFASCVLAPLALAQISGTVKLDGKAPEPRKIDMAANPDCAKLHPDPVEDETVVADDKGHLANVIVSIKPADGQSLGEAKGSGEAVLDQAGCMYAPHVIALQVGQALVIKNSDEFMHNVHSLSDENPPINQAMPTKDVGGIRIKDLKAAETFMVKCDVHPWMKAWVGVFEHPYFAVTKDDGTYSIDTKGLKDGDYTLQAWQEQYGAQTAKITVKGGKATADFTIKPEAKADASTKDKPMACCQITRTALLTAAAPKK